MLRALYCNCKHVYNGALCQLQRHIDQVGHIPEQTCRRERLKWRNGWCALDMFLVGLGFCSCTAVLKFTFVDLKTGVCTLQIQNQPNKESNMY